MQEIIIGGASFVVGLVVVAMSIGRWLAYSRAIDADESVKGKVAGWLRSRFSLDEAPLLFLLGAVLAIIGAFILF